MTAQPETTEVYPCVFMSHRQCPIRTKWKLEPESLAMFCQACPLLSE